MGTTLTNIEKDATVCALKHYMLQCEIWRDASGTVDSTTEGQWALMIERLAACISKISQVRTVEEEMSVGKTHRLEVVRRTDAQVTMYLNPFKRVA